MIVPDRPPGRLRLAQGRWPLVAGGCILFGCLVAGALGQDADWDLQNYHLYNAFSLLHARQNIDIYAVGLQSYFNPLLDIPYYLAAVTLFSRSPLFVTYLAGIPFGAFVCVVIYACLSACRRDTVGARAQALIAACIGLSGATVVSEVGTVMGDIQVGILVVASIAWPLRLLCDGAAAPAAGWSRAALSTGLLLGIAGGLKLPACLYAPAAFAAFAVTAGGARALLYRGSLLCLAFGLGFAATYGWWGAMLWRHFGNPMLPMMNDIFRSPWLPPLAFRDYRFMPKSVPQAIFYPFYWRSSRPVVTELNFADPRFAATYVAIGLIALAAVVRKIASPGQKPRLKAFRIEPAELFLLTFFVVSFALWEAMFSILRYLVPLEALTGLIVAIAVRRLSALPMVERYSWAPALLLLAVGAIIESRTQLLSWGRVASPGQTVIAVDAPRLPDGSAVLVAGRPLGFVLPFLRGSGVSFLGDAGTPDRYLVWQTVRQRLSAAPHSFILINQPVASYAGMLQSIGWRVDPTGCLAVKTNLQDGVKLCAIQKAA